MKKALLVLLALSFSPLAHSAIVTKEVKAKLTSHDNVDGMMRNDKDHGIVSVLIKADRLDGEGDEVTYSNPRLVIDTEAVNIEVDKTYLDIVCAALNPNLPVSVGAKGNRKLLNILTSSITARIYPGDDNRADVRVSVSKEKNVAAEYTKELTCGKSRPSYEF